VVAKFRQRIAVNKQGLHKFHMERFNLKMLSEVEEKRSIVLMSMCSIGRFGC
jgi:hypothetical protein